MTTYLRGSNLVIGTSGSAAEPAAEAKGLPMRRWMVAVVSAVGLVLMACAPGCKMEQQGEGGGPSPTVAGPKRYPARQFNSKVSFEVWVLVDITEAARRIGTTPAEAPLEIPDCEGWWVVPKGPIEEAVAEIKAKGIPGLELPESATDADLAHLQGLTGLQTLLLRRCRVTDAGLAHLKGLTGLQRLDIWRTQVTDSGLEHIKGLTGLRTLDLKYTQVTEPEFRGLRRRSRTSR